MRPALLLLLGIVFGCAARPAPVVAPDQPQAAESPTPKPPPTDEAAWRNERPRPGPASSFSYPVPEHETLDNQLQVFRLQRAATTVQLAVLINSGSHDDPKDKSGLAALTARLLTEGTQKLDSLALARAVEDLGARLDFDVSREQISISIEVMAEDVQRALSLLSDVVIHPGFRPADFRRVRAQWIEQLVAERQSPSRLASLASLRLLLGEQLGAPVHGSPKSVERISRADVAAFHRRVGVASNAALVVVGNVPEETLRESIRTSFGTWQAGTRPRRDDLASSSSTPQTQAVHLVDRPGAVQSAVFMVQRFPKRSEPGHERRELFSTLFGGLFTSRLNQNLREAHGYTYGAGSHLVATRDWGAFIIATSVQADVTGAAMKELMTEIGDVSTPSAKRPITAAEVQRARADLTQGLGADLEHVSRMAGNIEETFELGLPLDYHSKYPDTLSAITPEQVQTEAQRLDPTKLLTVIVGDVSVIEPQLRSAGFATAALGAEWVE